MSRQFTESDAVRYLQTYLRAQHLRDQSFPSVPVDGIFDSRTRLALTEFQERNGLSPTGTANRETWDLLYMQYLEISSSSSLPEPIIPFPSYPADYAMERGDRSFLVAIVQYMLREISVVYNTTEPVEITGVYDEATEAAVTVFQRLSGISPTGKVERESWAALARIFNLSEHYIDQK